MDKPKASATLGTQDTIQQTKQNKERVSSSWLLYAIHIVNICWTPLHASKHN